MLNLYRSGPNNYLKLGKGLRAKQRLRYRVIIPIERATTAIFNYKGRLNTESFAFVTILFISSVWDEKREVRVRKTVG